MDKRLPARVVVIDDRALPRAAARAMLSRADDFVVVGEAANAKEAYDLVDATRPDVLLMDVEMPGVGGAEMTRQMLARNARLIVLAWTVSDESDDLLRMIEAGCSGYVLKDVGPDELLAAMRAALRRDVPIPRKMMPAVLAKAAKHVAHPDMRSTPTLTSREQETLRLLARGLGLKQMAKRLEIAPSSVDTHIRNLYRKLGVNSRGAAIGTALRNGLLNLSDL